MRAIAGAAIAIAVYVAVVGAAAVGARPQAARAVPANGSSGDAAISADGRYVALASEASNLVGGDINGVFDVFMRDRVTATTERMSVGGRGAEANGRTGLSDLSADGRFVVMWSEVSNLVPGDTNGVADVFVRDRVAQTTERVSVSSQGAEADGESAQAAITPDGRFVAFATAASNFVPGDTDGVFDVFVRDRVLGRTEFIGDGWSPAISADGRVVVFEAAGTIVVHDRAEGSSQVVSVGIEGAPANGPSYVPTVSSDGRFVAFVSGASNLVPGDSNGPGRSGADVFVRDRLARTTERVSVGSAGTQADGPSSNPTISANGRVVAFTSSAPNIAGPGAQIVVRDLQREERSSSACRATAGPVEEEATPGRDR
jgi:Tol biopolymer transport system component